MKLFITVRKKFKLVISSENLGTAKREYKERTKEEVEFTKVFFNTDFIINNAIYEYRDFKQWLDFEKNIYECYGYDFEFLGLRTVQKNIEPTKASIGIYIDLTPNLKNSNSKLIICGYKYKFLQLKITACLHPAMGHATRESKNARNLIEARQQDADDFA